MTNSHRKQPKKRSWKVESYSNLIPGMKESAHLNENEDDTIGLDDFGDNLSRSLITLNDHKPQNLITLCITIRDEEDALFD